jgi:hypothetical protein
MSDLSYSLVQARFMPAEMDEGWLGECLSDDEVDLPKDLNVLALEDPEEDEEEEGLAAFNDTETWNDLSLDRFLNVEAAAGMPQHSSVTAQAMASALKAISIPEQQDLDETEPDEQNSGMEQ